MLQGYLAHKKTPLRFETPEALAAHLVALANDHVIPPPIIWSGSEEGSYLRRIDLCITQL